MQLSLHRSVEQCRHEDQSRRAALASTINGLRTPSVGLTLLPICYLFLEAHVGSRKNWQQIW